MADRKASSIVNRQAGGGTAATPAPAAAAWRSEPRGTPPPAGHHRLAVNLRQDLWAELQQTLGDGGPSVVVVIEALLALYIDDPRVRYRVNADSHGVAATRRWVARRARRAKIEHDVLDGLR